ncbi:zinc knuckle CX2CX4HX4C containing protein [Tanacetum coccineum]
MDKGFLNRKSSCKKHDDGGSMEKSSLLGNLAGKIKNIDGKIIGKDGKPNGCLVNCVRILDATKSMLMWIGMVKEIVSPNEGCSNSMVNDISSHTNDVHTTDKSSLSAAGMEKVMEGGPWRINLVPFILKEWKPNTLLKKEDVYTIPLWVKMHNVPIVAYKKLDWKSIELQRVKIECVQTEDKGKQIAIKPVVNTGKKTTDKKTSNTTKPPSLPDSSKDGKPNYISDDISFDAVRKFVNKSIEEESILEYIRNNTKEGCSSGEIQDDKVSSKKPSLSMEVLNADSDTDVKEVFQPDDGMSFPISSFVGGQ